MKINTLIKAAQHYYGERYSFLLKQLEKHSNQLEYSNQQDCLPYLLFKKNDVYLWIKDKEISDFPFLFTEQDEISFILHSFFSSGETLYISREIDIFPTQQQIQEAIDNSLLTNNKEDFRFWTSLYKKLQ